MVALPDLDTVCVFLHKQLKSNMKDCHGRTQISMCHKGLQTLQQFISLN